MEPGETRPGRPRPGPPSLCPAPAQVPDIAVRCHDPPFAPLHSRLPSRLRDPLSRAALLQCGAGSGRALSPSGRSQRAGSATTSLVRGRRCPRPGPVTGLEGRLVPVSVSVHQPAPDRILAIWPDSTPYLSCMNGTRPYCVDVDHQATDMAAWRFGVRRACPWLLAWWLTCLGRWLKVAFSSWSEAGGRRAMQQHAAGAGGRPSSPTSPPGRPHRFGLVRLVPRHRQH